MPRWARRPWRARARRTCNASYRILNPASAALTRAIRRARRCGRWPAALDDADIPCSRTISPACPGRCLRQRQGDLKNGNNYYQSKCGACHGGQAEGNPGLNAPGLAWLDAAYLKHQFQNFQLGVRGTHPGDTYGRQMKMMSTSLPTDKDLDDVIAYIQSLAKAL